MGTVWKFIRKTLSRKTFPKTTVVENSEQSQFTSEREKLAHELLTPLAEILNYALVLRRKDLTDIPPVLERLESAATRAIAIISASQFKMAGQSYYKSVDQLRQPQVVNINTLVEIAVNTVRDARREHVVFRRVYSARCCVECVPNEVIQSLINVLRNAYDSFMNDAGQIEIRTLQQESSLLPLGKIRIIVIDNGEGIPADRMKHIFAEGYSTRIGAGRGYGLAVTKQLVQKNEGAIKIYSPTQNQSNGRGTEVAFEFPRVRCASV